MSERMDGELADNLAKTDKDLLDDRTLHADNGHVPFLSLLAVEWYRVLSTHLALWPLVLEKCTTQSSWQQEPRKAQRAGVELLR